MFGTKQSMDYGIMTPLLEWQQIPSQQQSVLFLGQHYQQTTEKLFRDKVCYVWDTLSTDYGKMISRQSALCFGQHYMDYGKIFERQSALCLGPHYQRITEK